MKAKILFVEDEASLGATMLAYLEAAGFAVEWVKDGAEVLATFERFVPDLVLLDLMLPNVDGISLCRQLRQQSTVPIMMQTARVDELDRLLGLDIGADDYICKPYSPREVVARVKAMLRRVALDRSSTPVASEQAPLFEVDEDAMEVRWLGQSLSLTTLEFRLLKTFLAAPRRVFNREQLIDAMYTDHRIVSDRTVDSHITKLRSKLAEVSQGADCIQSVYGAGYKLQLPEAD
jgi:two-component system response regulator BaeR